MDYQCSVAGEDLVFHKDGSLCWPAQNALFIADVHLGKTNHFRREGIAIPYDVQTTNFRVLEEAIRRHAPCQVFFLGDLFHSNYNKTWALFCEKINDWNSGSYHLIEGNHDVLQRENYQKAGISLYEEPHPVGPFALCHHPTEVSGYFVLCGHLHPGVRLSGKGRQQIRLSCFWIQQNTLVLPAFGTFKGMKIIHPKKTDKVLALSPSGIHVFR